MMPAKQQPAKQQPTAEALRDGPFVSMSCMDYEIALRVFNRLPAAGLTDEELSFLMGKRNKYFFDLLSPMVKDKFKTEQLDVLPTILNTTIRRLIPNDVLPGEMIRLYAPEKKRYKKRLVYRHWLLPEHGRPVPVEWEKPRITGTRRKVNDDVHAAVVAWSDAGFFSTPRRALTLYLKLRKENPGLHAPVADLQKTLAVLTRNAGDSSPVLQQLTDDGCDFYQAVTTDFTTFA